MAYTDDEWDVLADEFEDHLAQGGGVNEFFEPKGRPNRHTFYARMKRDAVLEERYERALKWRAILMMDEMERVSTEIENGKLTPQAGGAILKNLQWRSERFFKKMFGTPQVAQTVGNDDVKMLIMAAMQRRDELEPPTIVIDGATSK